VTHQVTNAPRMIPASAMTIRRILAMQLRPTRRIVSACDNRDHDAADYLKRALALPPILGIYTHSSSAFNADIVNPRSLRTVTIKDIPVALTPSGGLWPRVLPIRDRLTVLPMPVDKIFAKLATLYVRSLAGGQYGPGAQEILPHAIAIDFVNGPRGACVNMKDVAGKAPSAAELHFLCGWQLCSFRNNQLAALATKRISWRNCAIVKFLRTRPLSLTAPFRGLSLIAIAIVLPCCGLSAAVAPR
jgi:hypothetical protein